MWATILALIWLHGLKLDVQDEWQLLAIKAASWIRAQKGNHHNNKCWSDDFNCVLVILYIQCINGLFWFFFFYFSTMCDRVCGSWKCTVGMWGAERFPGDLKIYLFWLLLQDWKRGTDLLHPVFTSPTLNVYYGCYFVAICLYDILCLSIFALCFIHAGSAI